jgi:hypothetical protein
VSLAFVSHRSLGAEFVEHQQSPGAFPVATTNQIAPICVDGNDFRGVTRAANDLADDIGRVSGKRAELIQAAQRVPSRCILIGSVGKSAIIDGLVKAGKLDVTDISGKWESYIIQVVDRPMPGVDSALVIAGSDKRGTIYGIYDLSEQMGVSPWYWWADVPAPHSETLFVPAGRFVQGPPKVKYRGIFINDEEPALGPWSREKFGGVNSKMYSHMFELILRLKGNYLWPAMWGKSFTEDDPESPRLADEYGIVIGTSHHEPMMRAQLDWTKSHKGPWDYATNRAELAQFWQDGLERNKNYETLITIGMRGDGDEPMVKGGDMQANTRLLERIVADQRKMIAATFNPDVTKVPQLWALYKEVADYYDHGMRVPDDVTLLWCDDNWGNVRRLPTPEERRRSGGAGIYYHFDYVGGPRSYKWINTNPLPKIWEQMNLAYQNGADRIWIVNVGDLKPMEIPIEFFLQMAWDPDAIPKEKVADFTRRWAKREFGPTHAQAIADIVSKYAKYNGWRKPELLAPTTFSLVNYQEADRVLEGWQSITADAEKIYAELPANQRDAFYQLVLYPTKACATVAKLYIAAGRNRLYAKQQRASTNDQADRVVQLFKQDQELSDYYNHTLSGGKWNHMMDEIRIGYTSWNTPRKNVMPQLTRIRVPENASLGVAIDGSDSAWPGGGKEPVLPPLDSINQQRYWIDVFDRGNQPFEFTADSNQPWIKLSQSAGKVEKESRLWVTVDWSAAPAGSASGAITVARTGGESVAIKVDTVRSEQFTRESIDGAFGGLTGPIAIAAESANKNVEAAGAQWEKIPDYGRGISGMAVFPVTAPSVEAPPQGSPCLEYRVLIAEPGDVQVDLVTSPTLDYVPGRGLRLAVSFDDQRPQILDAYARQSFADPSKRADLSSPAARDWDKWVEDNARTLKSSHNIGEPGVHTLKVWMVDPGVVLQKLIVHHQDVRPSYFGPPEVP